MIWSNWRMSLLFLVIGMCWKYGFGEYVPPWVSKDECRPPKADFVPQKTFPASYPIKSSLKNGDPLKYMNCEFGDGKWWGQAAEDAIVYERFFTDDIFRGNGFFVEMGGLDGWMFSNTFLFEHCLGWNGMLIEAEPKNFKSLVENRPCTMNVWSAACPTGTSFLPMTQQDGTSQIQVADDGKQTTLVPCRPLSAIFDEYGVTWIDFFSLDVEGHEAVVLETMDFNKVKIGVIIVELERLGMDTGSAVASAKNARVHELLTAAGMIKMPPFEELPPCRQDIKSGSPHGSALYTHPSLRLDVCPGDAAISAGNSYSSRRQSHRAAMARRHHRTVGLGLRGNTERGHKANAVPNRT